MRSRAALVTGGAGFIGSHLADRLRQEGFFVKVLDNFSSGRFDNIRHLVDDSRVEVIKGDLKKTLVAQKAVEGIDVVFHFAANPEVRLSATHPKIHFEENVVATFNLLDAIRKNSEVKTFILASTSAVYGNPDALPVSEHHSHLNPVSVYGASKLAGEALVTSYSNLYGFKAALLRYANIIGPRLRHGVIYDFLKKLMKKPEELEILGDGTQIRSYLFVDDAVEATMKVWRNMNNGISIYNVGNGDSISVKEIANIAVDELGLEGVKYKNKIVTSDGSGWPGDVKKITLGIEALKRLGWRPKLRSEEAVRRTTHVLIEELG